MSGLLAIYKKQNVSAKLLKEISDKGLKSLSHRGSKACTPFLSDKNLHITDSANAEARMIISSCSDQNNESHIASHNGNILLFEGRLINRSELCGLLSNVLTEELIDSEIVIRLLEKSGTNCLKLLKGFWSLIYFDSENKSIYGARDHFGNRTMYFCNTGGQFALASESRALYSLFDDVRSLNKDTIIDFLLWGNIGQADQYFFNDIHSIEPAHLVKYETESNKLTVERYYSLAYNQSNISYSAINENQYLNKLRSLISDSVKENINLFGGSLAIGVSGGMDSSALICTAKKTNPDRTLVAYTTTDEYDGGEAYWAEKVVRHTGAEWIKVMCTANQIIEKSDAVSRVHSTPLYNPSSLAQYRVMEEVKKQGQTVIIDGQGGDEMLGGYQIYFPLFLKTLRKSGEWKNWKNELWQVENSGMTKKEMFMRRLKLWAKAHYYTPQVLAQKKR